MIILPLALALAVVVAVVVVQRRSHHVLQPGGGPSPHGHVAPSSMTGRWSLVVLAVGLLFWSLTFTELPIYYAAVLGLASFALATLAYRQSGDHAATLWLPLVLVPTAIAATLAFVLLS